MICLLVIVGLVVKSLGSSDGGDVAASSAPVGETTQAATDDPTPKDTYTATESVCDQISLSSFGDLASELEFQGESNNSYGSESSTTCAYYGDLFAEDRLFSLNVKTESYEDASSAKSMFSVSREVDEDFYPDATFTDLSDIGDEGYMRAEYDTDLESVDYAVAVRSANLVVEVDITGYGTFDESALSDMMLAQTKSVLALL